MKKKMMLSKQDILHLAKLANLQISEKEVEKYRVQLGETLSYIENLKELDTDKVAPTNHTVNLTNVTFKDGKASTRNLTQKEALKNAKNKKGNSFIVKRIIG